MKHFFRRTVAYFIDCSICYTIIMLVIQWGILSNIRESIGITNVWFEESWNMEMYVLISISLPVWFYFIYFDSEKANGTFGKRIMNLSVRDDDANQRISLVKSSGRTFLKLCPWEIAHIGIIFPAPIYFEEDPVIRFVTIIGIVLFITFMISIMVNTNGRSLYDKIIGTKVISKPRIERTQS